MDQINADLLVFTMGFSADMDDDDDDDSLEAAAPVKKKESALEADPQRK